MHVWVIGSSGMLGSSIAAAAAASGARVFPAATVPWSNACAAIQVLRTDAERFALQTQGDDWAVMWAAGSSVVSSSHADTSSELAALDALTDAICATHPSGRGAFFLTSSAGGVYAGSSDPPFDATTTPVSISPYGDLKLDQERIAQERLHGLLPLVIGRFSNLYGPGHNESKGQGLIPMLCLATLRRTPLNLFVSMDTVRDYLYVDDAAAMAWSATERAVREQQFDSRVAVIASGQPTTVAQVIATVQNVAHRRVPLALGTHPSSNRQTVDLRLIPSPELIAGRESLTTLPSGIKLVFDAVVGRVN